MYLCFIKAQPLLQKPKQLKQIFPAFFPVKATKTATRALLLCCICLLQLCPHCYRPVRVHVLYRHTYYLSRGILKQEPPERTWGRAEPVGTAAQQRHQATLNTGAGGPRTICSLQQPYVFRQSQSLSLGRQHSSHCWLCLVDSGWWYVLTRATMNFRNYL